LAGADKLVNGPVRQIGSDSDPPMRSPAYAHGGVVAFGEGC